MAMALSPRISFSNDIDLSDPPPSSSPHSSHNFEFDFSVDTSLDDTSSFSPADHLFSQGKLIPLSLLQLNHTTTTTTSSSSSSELQLNCYKPNNNPVVSRSCSVGAGVNPALPKTTVNPFPRSRSTGSYMTNPSEDGCQRRSVSRKKNGNKNGYYYSAMYNNGRNNTGVRIDPVINVSSPLPLPLPFISRGGSGSGSGSSTSTGTSSSGSGGGSKGSRSSLFAYLLCNCRDKSVKDLGFCYSP